jgi:microcystin-dependent protein
MSNKVTDFAALTSLADDDLFYIVQVSDDTDKKITAANASASFGVTPSGAIMPFAMSTAPSGWLLADGSAVSRATYAGLFSAIGTTWGAGDGSTTFNLPDLRGAFVRGAGSHGTETMADGNAYAGPAVGSYKDDQMQGFAIEWAGSGSQNTGDYNSQSNSAASGYRGSGETQRIITDGTNGTPRTGDETRPFAAGVYYCIKT